MVNSLTNTEIGTRSLNYIGIQSKEVNKIKVLRFQHHCVSSIGGFLGAYSIMNYHEMLASAQTANLIDIVMCLLGKDLSSFLIRLGALMLYLLGFFITIYIPKFTKINLQTFSLCMDVVAVVLMATIPHDNMNDIVALYPMFFAMAIQWNSFIQVENYSCSTIFSTNNLKQATTSLMEYLLDREKSSQKIDKCKFYSGSILGYHLGVALAFCSYKVFSSAGIWLCFIPIVISAVSHIKVSRQR